MFQLKKKNQISSLSNNSELQNSYNTVKSINKNRTIT